MCLECANLLVEASIKRLKDSNPQSLREAMSALEEEAETAEQAFPWQFSSPWFTWRG